MARQFAISQLIEETVASRGWRLVDLVRRMGYANVSRGLRRLAACRHGAVMPTEFLQRLAAGLGVPAEVLAEALQETQSQREMVAHEYAYATTEAQRRVFRPHLFLLTSEQRPTFITGAAFIGPALRRVELDDGLLTLPLEAQLPQIGARIRMHFQEADGECPLFGRIIGYRYYLTFETAFDFAPDGTMEACHAGIQPEDAKAVLTVGATQLTQGVGLSGSVRTHSSSDDQA